MKAMKQPSSTATVPVAPIDQAQTLRRRVAEDVVRQAEVQPLVPIGRLTPRIVAVTSGKGGVGKTNLAVNLAVSLSQVGRRVLVFDGDVGTANVDVLMGMSPRPGLADVLNGRHALEEVIAPGHFGIRIVPGVSGMLAEEAYAPERRKSAMTQLEALSDGLDFVIIDTGAGIGPTVLSLLTAAPDALVVVTPEPTSITDAYALIKVVNKRSPSTRLQLVINQAATAREGKRAARNLSAVAKRFLALDLPDASVIPRDHDVLRAVRQQMPVVACYPDCPAARAIAALALRLDGSEAGSVSDEAQTANGIGWANLLGRLFRRDRQQRPAVLLASSAVV